MPDTHHEYVGATAVLCDEIRKEDNGKLLLIGVYSGEILIDQVPTAIAFSAYMNLFLPGGKSVVSMRLRSGDEISPKVELTAEGATPITLGIPTPRIPITFKAEGVLQLEVQFNKTGDWQEVVKK